MRKVLIPILCLFLGLTANLVVAWLCAINIQSDWQNSLESNQTGQFMQSWRQKRLETHEGWHVQVQSRFGVTRAIATNGAYAASPASFVPAGYLPSWSTIRELPEVSFEDDYAGYIDAAYGWPKVSFWHTWMGMTEEGKPEVTQPGSWHVGSWRLPLRPIPLGMAINTIFYAALAFGVMSLPGLFRRYGRLALGRCPGCGMMIVTRDGRVCDDCGHAVTWARA